MCKVFNLARCARVGRSEINWARLGRAVRAGVRFLDNVIDLNHYPDPRIRGITLGNRKIGLGVMGFADCLILLAIRYDSLEAVNLATRISRFIQHHAHAASQLLAQERGAFPNWPGSIWDTQAHVPVRNASCTTVAVHVVQKLAVHSDIKTTQRYYLSVQEEDLERAKRIQSLLVGEAATDPKLTHSGQNEAFCGPNAKEETA